MKEIIKITEHNGKKAVSARDLHAYLEVNTRFDTWVNRMFEYGFEEGKDFCTILGESTGGRPSKDFVLALDTAKEISMLQRNDKGKVARQYFIEVERKAKQPQDPITLLRYAADEIEKRDAQIAQLKPKADFADRVIDHDHLIDIGQAAKMLKLKYGRNTLFKKLRELGIFFKQRNEPKQDYIQRGYFELREKEIKRDNHPSFIINKVLVTQKGLEYLHKQLADIPLYNNFSLRTIN